LLAGGGGLKVQPARKSLARARDDAIFSDLSSRNEVNTCSDGDSPQIDGVRCRPIDGDFQDVVGFDDVDSSDI